MNFQFQILTGYAYGALQPGVILKARHVPDAANQLSENLAVFLENLPPPEQDVVSVHTDAGLDDDHLLVRLVQAVHLVGLECGDLRLTPILWTRVDDAVQVYVPTLSPKLIIWAFKTIVENLEARSDPMTANIQAEFMDQIMQKSLRLLPSGTNARSLIDSAAARRMPFYIFDRKHIVFGYGAGSHVMSSSITDRESGIGVTLAKSKAATNRYLRLSGFPVTKQAMVRSFEDVKLFAETNGFPIVLKPTAEEQGRGVTTYIQSLDEAKKALTDLRKTYKHLLVEQHYHGDGYRVYVLDGQVVRVRKLSAAAVTGDGTSTIKQLIDVENANPMRSASDSALKKIVVDSTLKEMLSKQALDLEAVPDAGVKVVLSPTSNLSRGGTSVDFTDQLHPENRKLCEEIGQTMCLLCSGVDMISVDASRPWHENGAVICEVNSQPQIGLKGRIHVHDMLIDGLGVKNTPISIEVHADATEYDAPLFDRSQDTLHLKVSAQRILQSGCPVQYFDTVTYADDVPEDMRAQVAAMLKSVPLEERAT